MATLIGLVGKLRCRRREVGSAPATRAGLGQHRVAPGSRRRTGSGTDGIRAAACSGLGDEEIADVRAERWSRARGGRPALRIGSQGIDEHIAPCLERRDFQRPFAVGVAATVAAFAAAYHYDLDEVNRIQAWAAPAQRTPPATASIWFTACATPDWRTGLMLDIATAEGCFRKALKISPSGPAAVTPGGPAGELGAWRIALRAWRSRRGRPPFGGELQGRARGWLGRLQDRPLCHRGKDQERCKATGVRRVYGSTRPSGCCGHCP